MKHRHRFVVTTPREINALGVTMCVPVTGGGRFSRENGLNVAISGHETSGVAVCNQVRSFDIETRVKSGTAQYVETLDESTVDKIVARSSA
jgi:mRNA interferase ChpB